MADTQETKMRDEIVKNIRTDAANKAWTQEYTQLVVEALRRQGHDITIDMVQLPVSAVAPFTVIRGTGSEDPTIVEQGEYYAHCTGVNWCFYKNGNNKYNMAKDKLLYASWGLCESEGQNIVSVILSALNSGITDKKLLRRLAFKTCGAV